MLHCNFPVITYNYRTVHSDAAYLCYSTDLELPPQLEIDGETYTSVSSTVCEDGKILYARDRGRPNGLILLMCMCVC